jgi:enoyl-CoA hydratase/carnithine racemase
MQSASKVANKSSATSVPVVAAMTGIAMIGGVCGGDFNGAAQAVALALGVWLCVDQA